eukprot:gb/GECG01014885.1/.p1 GENE.gb/GECG01014885.1/~~gb/GECG01014885.1/.p1  ORF type:complete len:1228 (+),score=133.40 gb/GECG01014885.1/:1-3684(+)
MQTQTKMPMKTTSAARSDESLYPEDQEQRGPRIPMWGSTFIISGAFLLFSGVIWTMLSAVYSVAAEDTEAGTADSFFNSKMFEGYGSVVPRCIENLQWFYDFCATEHGRRLIWGIMIRGLAGVWIVSLLPLVTQIVPMHGSDGYDPCCKKFAHLSRIWPSWQRFISIPTFFWFANGNVLLRLVPLMGALSAALVIVGGVPTMGLTSPVLLAFTWIMALNTDKVVGMLYPWDCLIMESGVLALFLPRLNCMPLSIFGSDAAENWQEGLSTDVAPNGLMVFMFRYLLFRLMFGFGKLKFVDTLKKDDLYVKYFYINMPMTSPLGFLGYYLPDFVHVLSLKLMWVSEMPAPFLFLFSGWARIIAAIGTFCLQIGIQSTGNFGYFNLLTSVLCIGAFDHGTDLFPYLQMASSALGSNGFTLPAFISTNRAHLLHWLRAALDSLPAILQHGTEAILLALYSFCHSSGNLLLGRGSESPTVPFDGSWNDLLLLAFFLFITIPASVNIALNSWCAIGWHYWPGLRKLSPSTIWNPFFAYLRLITAFRLNHAYGVFPPNSSPPRRWCPIFEGSFDGEVWRQFHLPYMINDSKSKPVFVAPHHPRVDHAIFYESFGSDGHGFNSSVGSGDPLTFSRSGPWRRLQAKLLEGSNSDAYNIFWNDPFPDPNCPPKYVRVSFYCYKPKELGTALRTGEYWDVIRGGTHLPTLTIDDTKAIWDDWLVDPERFHPDHMIARESMQWTSGGVTEEEYEEVWDFITFIREQAFDVALNGLTEVEVSPRKRSNSLSKKRKGQNGQSNQSRDQEFPDPREVLPDIELPEELPVRVEGPLDPAHAAKMFNWATLPHVWRAVDTCYSREDLFRIENNFSRMASPLRAKHEFLLHRPPPTSDQVRKEVEADVQYQRANSERSVENDPVWNDDALRIEAQEGRERLVTDDDFGGERWRAYVANRPHSQTVDEAKKAFASPGKDWESLYRFLPTVIDSPTSGPPSEASFMPNAFRVSLFSDWYMLVGGRHLYERAVDGRASIVGGHRLPLVYPLREARPWKSNASNSQVALEASQHAEAAYSKWDNSATFGFLFRQTNSPLVNISGVTLQSLMYVKSVFFYQSFASMMTKAKIMQRVLRPEMPEIGGGIIPGWLEVGVQMKDWPALRMWDHHAGDWVEPVIAPVYKLDGDDPHWIMISDGTKEAGRKPDGQDVVSETEISQKWSEEERQQWARGQTPPRVLTQVRRRVSSK